MKLKAKKLEIRPKRIVSRLVRPPRLKGVAHKASIKKLRKHSKELR